MIGMSGFSEAVRNERGVRELKEIGADFASGVPMTDRATLDLFAKYGLKATVGGLPKWWGGKTKWVGQMAERVPLAAFEAAATNWTPHPAILNVVVGDEPGMPDFAHYGKVMDLLRAKMPGASFTVPIFPSYGATIAGGDETARIQMGTADYAEYVRAFLDRVPQTDDLSMDFYPYSAPAETRDAYFLRRYADLATVARAARGSGKRLQLYVQSNSVFKDLEMSLPMLRYQAFTALAFGATSLKFTCYTPSWWHNNILEKDGSKTPRYERVRQVIREIRAFDREFMRHRTVGTRFIGFGEAECARFGETAADSCLIGLGAADGGKLVVGEMSVRRGAPGRAAFIAAADDPGCTNVRMRRVSFRADGLVRVWGREGEVAAVPSDDGTWTLDLPSDGALLVTVAPYGSDDQIRYNTSYHPDHHDRVKAMGFNLVGGGALNFTHEFRTGCAVNTNREGLVATLKRLDADGIACIAGFKSADRYARDTWPSRRKDGSDAGVKRGKRFSRFVDATNPGYQAALEKGAHAVAKEYAEMGIGSFAGFRGVEEVRLHSEPSFTPVLADSYRAFCGCEVPAEAEGRAAPAWKRIPGMPKDRIVPDSFPLLMFYRWFWQHGDGWGRANDIAREAFQAHFDRPLFSIYAPGLRMPRLSGIGGGNSHLCEWVYLTPVPFVISYAISELQANARGTGAEAIPTVDGVIRRGHTAPPDETPANPPAWLAAVGKRDYITVPPDYLREGYWLMMARRTDGIGLSVGASVFGIAPGERHWGCACNPDTLVALEQVCRDAAVPLGPLLKNMPERDPEVAILDSHTGALLSGQAPWDWSTASRPLGYIATAANLTPYSLFEEEMVESGVPASVKVIYAAACDVLTERAAAELERFRARGGRVIASKTLAPGVKADGVLPDCAAVMLPKNATRGKASDDAIRACAAELRRVTGLEPYADADNAWLLTFVRTYGDSDVVFAVNDRREAGDYVGPWGRILEKGSANSGTVSVARTSGAVYDLVRHTAVPFECADGRTRIPLSFTTSDGRALLLVSKPLAGLSARVRDGIVTVLSPDRDAMIPVGIVDAAGRGLRYGVIRNGYWRGRLPAGAAKVLNLANGRTFDLQGEGER